MSNAAPRKIFIKVETPAEQQENLKNTRKTLKVLQSGATDKENLAGRPALDNISRIKAATESALIPTEYAKRKKFDLRSSETQTTPKKSSSLPSTSSVTVEDLTSTENPGEHYWELLSEKRREALEESLVENQRLHERIEGLEEELKTSRLMLEEARNLVEVLTEMLNENEAEKEIGNDVEGAVLEKCNNDIDDDNQSVTEPEEEDSQQKFQNSSNTI